MDTLQAGQLISGRAFMGDSLGFHILFALLGVGLPLFISLFEFLGIILKNNQLYLTARRWAFSMGALAVVGVVSGTIISLQMNLMWPTFMEFAGQVIGTPFFLEGYAFLIEAVFLAIYLYSWDRLGKWTHWLCSLPLVLGSAATAFFITTANAFMNNPRGFTLIDGVISDVHPWAAMFNPATFSETTHSIMSYYCTTGFALAALYAVLLLKKRVRENSGQFSYYQKLLTVLLGCAFVFAMLTVVTGDHSAKYVAKEEPIKFAAMEAHFATQANAPLNVGGLLLDGEWKYLLPIPGMLSFLAFGDVNATVRGLNDFDPAFWPPLYIHYFFDLMVGIGFYLTAIPLLYFALWKWRRGWSVSRIVLALVAAAGVVGFCAVEFGWMLTEIGRQPYIIRGVMLTAEAFTTSHNVIAFGYIFPAFYLILFGMTYWILRKHYRDPVDFTKSYFPDKR